MELVDNCSETAPTSEVFFAELSMAEKVGIGITTAVCIVVIVMFVEQAHFVIRKYQTGRDPEIKIKSLWLVGIYPMFALAALLAVYVPRAAMLGDLASSIYLAVCLFHFTSLIILYSGGIPQLLQKAESTGFSLRTPPCCCCCFCCPAIKATWPNLRKLRVMVFQTSFLQPFISFITLVLWLDEKYVKGKVAIGEAYIYLSIINAVSTMTAMYGLVILFRTSRAFLKKQSISQKFVVLQLVLIIHNLQGFIFVTLSGNDLPACRGKLSSIVRSNAIQHMVVVCEMLILAVLARCLYRRPHSFNTTEGKDGHPHPIHNGTAEGGGEEGEGEGEAGVVMSDAKQEPEERYRKLSGVVVSLPAPESGTDNPGFDGTN
ncbi:organic solute transporter subunit alpha-like [Littorina saxatilis]|uniref:Organic solute transporter subunit alpha-like n=1 Tax=Littorina saxatilis TaxID=31220 RepID=A0AAN9G9R8_9CAEN